MGIAAIISQKWVTRVEESEALTSEHSQCSLRNFHACVHHFLVGPALFVTKRKERAFNFVPWKHNQFVENGFKNLIGHINIHISQAIETLLVHCRALKF